MIDGLAAIGEEPPHSTPVEESSIEGMRASLAAAGYADAAAIEIEVTQTFADFDEYWEIQTIPFHRAGKAVQALDETRRAKLREHLREKLTAATAPSRMRRPPWRAKRASREGSSKARHTPLIPTQAGIQAKNWVPAFAGTSGSD